ncbi:MAG: hypothetical protein ABUK01_16095 [Leptospirales bacterium]
MKYNPYFTYNLNMVYRNKNWRTREPIANVLEIRLNKETWANIARVADSMETTYSWVVRYALFRFIRRGRPLPESVAQTGESMGSGQRLGNFHRHRLCLYGDDELFVRMFAGRIGVTMTRLVRMALARYLDSLLRKIYLGKYVGSAKFSARFFWLGVKSFVGVEIPTTLPPDRHFDFKRYPEKDYWPSKTYNPH